MTIDEIRIEGDEDGFHLIVYTDDGQSFRYRIGLPDQFHAEIERTIGRWLAAGEAARAYDPNATYHRRNPDLARDIERGK